MKRIANLAATVYREESQTTGDLIEALCRACLNFTPVVFDKIGRRDGVEYRYASVMSIRRSTQAALANEGLFLHHCYGHNSEGQYVISVLRHKTGEFISSTLLVPQRADIQEQGGVMTFLCRKATEGLLAVTTEEDDDGASCGESEVEGGKPETKDQAHNLSLAMAKVRNATSEKELSRYLEIAKTRVEEGVFHTSAIQRLATVADAVRERITKESADADKSRPAGTEEPDAAGSGGSGTPSPKRRAAGTGRGDARVGESRAPVAAG